MIDEDDDLPVLTHVLRTGVRPPEMSVTDLPSAAGGGPHDDGMADQLVIGNEPDPTQRTLPPLRPYPEPLDHDALDPRVVVAGHEAVVEASAAVDDATDDRPFASEPVAADPTAPAADTMAITTGIEHRETSGEGSESVDGPADVARPSHESGLPAAEQADQRSAFEEAPASDQAARFDAIGDLSASEAVPTEATSPAIDDATAEAADTIEHGRPGDRTDPADHPAELAAPASGPEPTVSDHIEPHAAFVGASLVDHATIASPTENATVPPATASPVIDEPVMDHTSEEPVFDTAASMGRESVPERSQPASEEETAAPDGSGPPFKTPLDDATPDHVDARRQAGRTTFVAPLLQDPISGSTAAAGTTPLTEIDFAALATHVQEAVLNDLLPRIDTEFDARIAQAMHAGIETALAALQANLRERMTEALNDVVARAVHEEMSRFAVVLGDGSA